MEYNVVLVNSTYESDDFLSLSWSVAFFVFPGRLLVQHVQDEEDFTLAHTLSLRVKSVESWVDHVDEGIVSLAVLQPSAHPIGVHLRDEGLELITG